MSNDKNVPLPSVLSSGRLYPHKVARNSKEHPALTGTVEDFLRRGLAAQRAVDTEIAKQLNRCLAEVGGGRCAGLVDHDGDHYANARDRKEVR